LGRNSKRPKFREETPRRRTVRPQPAIVTALHNVMHGAAMSSWFFETPGAVESFGSDQEFSPPAAGNDVQRTSDGFLTMGEMPGRRLVPPPPLDADSAVFLDVDGTLLEIAPRPDLVRVPSILPMLLGEAAQPRGGALALVSGRPLQELDLLFRPWRGAAAGLHGIERRRADGTLDRRSDQEAAAALDRIRPRLAALAGDGSGVMIEDKQGTLALHYRAAPERADRILGAARALQRETGPALRLIEGKMVVEFQPRSADKGAAIAAFLEEPPFLGRRPVFVGDDVTDEDGFAEIDRRGGLAIRVGPPAPTLAGYGFPGVSTVLAWLGGSR
jgi:trehalose 6-phosphate phosphatase